MTIVTEERNGSRTFTITAKEGRIWLAAIAGGVLAMPLAAQAQQPPPEPPVQPDQPIVPDSEFEDAPAMGAPAAR